MDKATKSNLVAAGIGVAVGVVIGVAIKMAHQQNYFKGFIPQGAVLHKKLPPWAVGRKAEEVMANDLKAAVYRGKNNPKVRELAIQIIKDEGLDGRQHKEIAAAFQRWMQSNIVYVNDPVRTEIFQEAYKTLLETKAGDCDDQAVALASLLMSVGIPAKLVLLSQDEPFDKKARFRHIFVTATIDGRDYWVETILPKAFDERHPHTGLMFIDLSIPNSAKKVVVPAKKEEMAGLYDAAFLEI
jgi:hypothetical protein